MHPFVPTCEKPGSLIDIESDHFTTFVVLSSFLKERAQYEPSQEVSITNSIWRMVEENNISLGSAMEFVAAQPKPIPQSRRILDAWWKHTQNSME
jgi:predicted P-loop ATPase/GTPase